MGNQGHLAKAARPFIGIKKLQKHVFAFRGACFRYNTVFKSNRDIFDQRALMRERFGRGYIPVYLQRMWGGKHLF